MSYAPDKTIVRFMTDTLRFSKKMEKLGMKISAGSRRSLNDASVADIERYKNLRYEKRKLDRRKIDVLNKHIFPSMANLTVFLEYIAESYRIGCGGYVNKIFEEDLEALFFAKSTVDKSKSGAYIFRRFIDAICTFDINILYTETAYTKATYTETEDTTTKAKTRPIGSFRLMLCDIMQESINKRLVAAGPFRFNDGLFIDKTLGPDMDRARAWTRMLAQEAYEDLKFDKERRPALF
jgi:hypothetical protein